MIWELYEDRVSLALFFLERIVKIIQKVLKTQVKCQLPKADFFLPCFQETIVMFQLAFILLFICLLLTSFNNELL